MTIESPIVIACIPAYREENTIAKMILSAQKHVDRVVVCDDGSDDMTAEIAEKLGAIVVRHESNRGKGHALKSLLGMAMRFDADVTVLLDGDGQHNPDEIPILVEPILESKADLVLGSRYIGGTMTEAPLYRRYGLKVLNFLHRRVSKLPVSDPQCGFRALSRKALDAVIFFEQGGYGADAEIISLAKSQGITIVEVPITVRYNGLRKTSKKAPLAHGGELVSSLLRTVIEERPLKYLGLPGTMLLFTGMLAMVYMGLIFNSGAGFDIPAAIVAMGSTVAGLLLVVTAFILWGLQLIRNRIADLRTHYSSRDADEHIS